MIYLAQILKNVVDAVSKSDSQEMTFEERKNLSADANNKWNQFLKVTKTVTAPVRTFSGDLRKGFTAPGSIGAEVIKPALEAIGAENLKKAGIAALGPAIPTLGRALDYKNQEAQKWDQAIRDLRQKELQDLKENDPTNIKIPMLEEALAQPEYEPITPEKAMTTLEEKVYKPWHGLMSQTLLSMNEDVIKQAREDNTSPWKKAAEYKYEVSPGQAFFDLGSETLNADMFNFDITDPEQRNYLFYEGDGLVGTVGKVGSGAADLGAQLIDPLWIGGKGLKAARLATLDVKTVREASGGIRGLFEQSFFVDGEKALQQFAKQQEDIPAIRNEITRLRQEKIRVEAAAAAGDLDDVVVRETLAEIDEAIAQQQKTMRDYPLLAAGWDEFFDQMIDSKMTESQIYQHPRMRIFSSEAPKLASAYALAAKRGDKRDLIDLTLSATNLDMGATARLTQRRASFEPILMDQKNQLKGLVDEINLYTGEIDNAEEVVKRLDDEAYKLYEAYLDEDRFLKAAVALEGERTTAAVGSLRPYASRFRSVEEYRAKTAIDRARISFQPFQVSKLSRPVYLARYAGERSNRYRPNNMVIIDGVEIADGVQEFTAWLQGAATTTRVGQRIIPNKVLSPQVTEKLLNDFISAPNRSAKKIVLREAERLYLRKLLNDAGIELPKQGRNEILDDFIEKWLTFKDRKTEQIQKTAFYTDANGNLVSNPLLRSELEYSHYMTDTEDLARWVRDNRETLRNVFFNGIMTRDNTGRQVWTVAKDVTQTLDQMWRFGVLARLGYPIRNVGTEWLKFAIAGGMFNVFGPQYAKLSDLPLALQKSIDNFVSNKHAFFERTAMRLELAKTEKIRLGKPELYFEFVRDNNNLRRGRIAGLMNMKYDEFRKLADQVRANPESLGDQTDEFIQAFELDEAIITSETKAAALSEKWQKAQKTPRNTGTMTVYGYEYEQAFSGTQGMAFRKALSSGPTLEMTVSGMRQEASMQGSEWMGVFTKIYPDDPEYFANLSNVIATDMVSSSAAKTVLETTLVGDAAFPAAKATAIEKLRKDPALREEILSTGRYDFYADEIAAEQKEFAEDLINAGFLQKLDGEFESKIVTAEEAELLKQNILPERFGFKSKDYLDQAKAEARRLAKEYDTIPTPDFDEKLKNLASALNLSSTDINLVRNHGYLPLSRALEALKKSRLESDELSAVISTGYIEAAGVSGHFAEGAYEFLDEATLKGRSFLFGNRRVVELNWAKQSKDDYIAENMARFNEEWGTYKNADLLDAYYAEQQDWVLKHKSLDQLLDNMPTSTLLKLKIESPDMRSIEERYFDDIFEMQNRYFPSAELRSSILALNPGDSITPQRLRFFLSEYGDNLTPITGDVLLAEERRRALAFRKIEGKEDLSEFELAEKELYDNIRRRDLINILDRKVRDWYYGRKSPETKGEKQFRLLTPEEKKRSIEAQERLRALSEDASFGLLLRKTRGKVMGWIGQTPEDNLVKWPFGKTMYNQRIYEIAESWKNQGFKPTLADVKAAESAARQYAIAQSRRYLYTANRKLRGPGSIPFLAPFYQAAMIGAKTWGRVTWSDPSIMARRIWMWDYVNQHADYDKQNGNRTVSLMLPESVINLLPEDSAYKRALNAFPELRFDTDSFNLIFPGMKLGGGQDNFDPVEAVISSIGLGPAAVMSVETLVKNNPYIDQKIYEETGQVIPMRGILDKFVASENITADPTVIKALPPLAKRALAAYLKSDSAEYARINLHLFMTYVHRMETGEMERESLASLEKRVQEETMAMITLKGLANLTLPAIPQFRGEVNTMIDVYREYQNEWKEKAFAEFIEDYPDWYIVATTLSDNPGGVLSTPDTAYMLDKHGVLINEVRDMGGGIGESLLGMIANREGMPTDFDPASRVWLINNEYYTRLGDPKKAIEQTQRDLGNQEYYAMRDKRDKYIKDIGKSIGRPDLTYQNTSVPQVAKINENFNKWVDNYAKENPTWYINEREPLDRKRSQPTNIRVARMLVSNEAWMADQKDGNWVDQLTDYLDLQERAANYINNPNYSDYDKEQIRTNFQNEINRLKRENDTFAYYYDRFFDGPNGTLFTDIVPRLD